MRTFILILAALFLLPVQASADAVCDYAIAAASHNAIRKTDYTSAVPPANSAFWAQYPIALSGAGITMTTNEPELVARYGYRRYVVIIGKQVYQAIGVQVGATPYAYLFDYDTRRLAFEVKGDKAIRSGAVCPVPVDSILSGHLFSQ